MIFDHFARSTKPHRHAFHFEPAILSRLFCEFHLNNLVKLTAIISIISCRETAGMEFC